MLPYIFANHTRCSIKVLFVGYHNPNFETITEYIEDAFLKNGHDLIIFDDRKFLIPGRIRSKIDFLQQLELKRINENLLRLIESEKPDLCLVSGGVRISADTINKIKAKEITTALWTIDAPFNFDPILSSAPAYDFIFCGGSEAVELLSSKPVNNLYWLPFACDTDKHYPVTLDPMEKKELEADIVFVGSYYPNRADCLETIADLNLSIWGPGWEKLAEDSPLRSKIKRAGSILPEEWRKIYSAAKLVVLIHYDDGKTLCHQASPKLYEAMACGRCVISDAQKDVVELFKDQEDLIIFEGKNSFREKVLNTLSNEPLVCEIENRIRSKIEREHTYQMRIKKMLEIITK